MKNRSSETNFVVKNTDHKTYSLTSSWCSFNWDAFTFYPVPLKLFTFSLMFHAIVVPISLFDNRRLKAESRNVYLFTFDLQLLILWIRFYVSLGFYSHSFQLHRYPAFLYVAYSYRQFYNCFRLIWYLISKRKAFVYFTWWLSHTWW